MLATKGKFHQSVARNSRWLWRSSGWGWHGHWCLCSNRRWRRGPWHPGRSRRTRRSLRWHFHCGVYYKIYRINLWKKAIAKWTVWKNILCGKRISEKKIPQDICPNCGSERMVFKEMISISDVNFGKIPLRQRISGKDSIQTCICPKNPWWNEPFGKISCVEREFQRKTFSTRYLSQLRFGKDGI